MSHRQPPAGRVRTLSLAFALLAALVCALVLSTGASAKPSCLGKKATIVSGKATIVGTKAPDSIIVSGGGQHTVRGLGGNDRICGGDGDDRLYGEKGADTIEGGGGNDFILGEKGGDKLMGGAGDDYIDGQKGSDQIDGGAGTDKLLGDKGNDTMDGGPGDHDLLEGGLGDEKMMTGGTGDGDEVFGGLGSDKVSGGPGNQDVVRGDSGNDSLEGGGGVQDIVSFATSPGSVVVNLGAGSASGDGHDTLKDVSDVAGSAFNDQITGDDATNRIDGGPGNDELDGGGPAGAGDPDEGFGGPGADGCQSFGATSSCNDKVPPQTKTAVEINRGLDGISLVVTGLNDDSTINLSYGGNAFVVTDPTGIEARETSGCTASGETHNPRTGEVTGGNNTATCPIGLGIGFILVDAGGGNDTVTVGAGIPGSLPVRMTGGPGNDTLNGGPGNDQLEAGDEYGGTTGNDILNGNGGNDGLVADPGADQLNGGDGNDLLVSSAAPCQGHRFDGGSGLDTVSYARTKAPGVLSMTLGGSGGPAGCGTPDQILSTNEDLEGSEGPDKMVGDTGNNTLFGHGGADIFMGKGGSDTIEAIDDEKDKLLDCGPGQDKPASKDPVDPNPKSC
jgi:Ca2+-binding RTX toxin-like protein